MKAIENWDSIEASGTRKRLIAGGYIARLTSAQDFPEREYLRIEYDIADGEFSGYGTNSLERFGFNPLSFIRSYKQTATGMFKAFITAVERSNRNFFADVEHGFDERQLMGKLVGLVIGEEEYLKRDATIGTRYVVAAVCTVEDIRAGRFTVPEKKKLPVTEAAPGWAPADNDSELPLDI